MSTNSSSQNSSLTSARQSALFGLEDWKRIYQTYRTANFTSYDYETLRKSFVDYLTLYYPETFNDYTESSEFVALLDVMAFMGQSLAFRGDLNTRENFIDTAERRDSVIKLANLVSYNPKRSIEANGLLKITAISTTENIIDINGISLGNQTIIWNDPANSNWQEQLNTILNSTLVNNQMIGRPAHSQNILNVTNDEYTINILQNQLPVVRFSTQINGTLTNFELVSVSSSGQNHLYELPPAPSNQFNFLYRNDGLGYGSSNTGFFVYFKQGTLQFVNLLFSERIQNNYHDVSIQGINNTDTWLYQLNSDSTIGTQWKQVDNIYSAANSTQGTSTSPIFSVASRANDQVTYMFGDGVFGEIPVGNFRAYVRSGNALTYNIDPAEMSGITANIRYVSRQNTTETLTITFSLQSVNSTAQGRQSIAGIKERAPARYYTQNRMVNGEDYTNFPFTLYNSIIKSSAVNRTSIGVSRGIDLMDPTGVYSSTNIFASDGALYRDQTSSTTSFSVTNINFAIQFLSQMLPSLLGNSSALQYYHEHYPRYDGYYPQVAPLGTTPDTRIYWNKTTVDGSSTTGYFYIINPDSYNTKQPISLGSYNTYNPRYIGQGAQLKFVSPTGYYFDTDHRLQQGVPNYYEGHTTQIWVGVTAVIGDGYNFGNGNLTNGAGPVTLNSYVPNGAYLATVAGIIPEFDTSLSTTLINQILDQINLKQDFALKFDNSILITLDRWTLVQPIPSSETDYFVKFVNNSIDNSYTVTIKNVKYNFASVDQTRFIFTGTQRVYDPQSGQIYSDYINILGTNSNATKTATLGNDYLINIVGQTIQSDGYPDDYQITVSSINPITKFTYDPDFFTDIVGTDSTAYVFFQTYTDIDNLYRTKALASGTVIYAYSSRALVEGVKYDYPAGTVFYCAGGVTPTFYQSEIVAGTTPQVLILNDVTSSYMVARGRSGINFQYRHNSDNTTRINPSTTNIIDLYMVTQSYYTQYKNWIQDTTDVVPLPVKPSIDELQQAYGMLDSYKMISDSVILNSVTFKPLFGKKADSALQATIKVIPNHGSTASSSQIISSVLAALDTYFSIDAWDFGSTFYFSELSAYLHVQLGSLISSVVLVPADPTKSFGELYEVKCQPNEIFVNGCTANDIVVISALTPAALQRIV